jgi:HK97 family phage portal protein
MAGMMEKVANRLGLMTSKQVEEMIAKGNSSWAKLWQTGREHQLFGDKVSDPYSQISTVYKSVKAIADNVPQAELKFYDKSSKKEIVDDEINVLFQNPNPLMSASDFTQAVIGFQALCGESMIIQVKSLGQVAGTRKLPAELWTFNPSHFVPVVGDRQILSWQFSGSDDQLFGNQTFRGDEVLYMKDFNPRSMVKGVKPTSPIEKIIDIDWQTLIFNKAFFENDATPGLTLATEQDMTQTQIDRTLESWAKRHQGANKAFKTAILEGGLKPVNVVPSHKDMDFIEQKKFTREEMYGIWRVPQSMFSITDTTNYATFMGQMKVFWIYGIMPALRKYETTINAKLVQPYNPRIIAKFDVSNVPAYQEDYKEKIDSGIKLQTLGFTGNEINEKLQLGFDPKPWRDVSWIPFSQVPADADKEDPAATDPAADPAPEDKPKDDKKDVKRPDELRRLAMWKGFIGKQKPIEDRLAAAVKTHFFEQRKLALAGLEKWNGKDVGINWDEQDEALKKRTRSMLLLAISEGVEHGKAIMGRKEAKSSDIGLKINSYLEAVSKKIVGINLTLKKQIGKTILEGTTAGETIPQIAGRVRDIYNMASNRSVMIARTETVGAVNGGSQLYYESEGIRKKEWLTARDEIVRESHRHLDGQVVPVTASFENGLDFPGDSSGRPEDVINCRCSLAPVID